MRIEIFRTNIDNAITADRIREKLLQLFPASKINFDLEDCDKILRIAGLDFNIETLICTVKETGFECEALN